MPFFRVELERSVSRRVKLRQTTSIVVEATDLEDASRAARFLGWYEEELRQYIDEWKDDDASSRTTEDEQEGWPRVERAMPTRMPYTSPWINAMPPPEVPNAE